MEFSLPPQMEEFFENVFAFSGTLTPQGHIASLSGTIFEKTFADPKLLIGQRFSETVFWQSTEQNYQLVNDALETATKGIKTKTVLEFRISAEEKSIVELMLYPIMAETDGNRRIKNIFVCGQDVTVREKEIEFYKKRSEQLLYAAESAEIGLWFWDLTEGAIFSTPKCNEFFEFSPHEAITYPEFLEIIHPDDRQNLVNVFVESQEKGTEYDLEYRVLHSDGSIHWLSTRGRTFLDAEGNATNMMGVVRKITERKNAEEELAKVYALEKKARDEAEEANRTKDYFLALVSHELRSPLNAILGWTKILLTKNVDNETKKNALETIERSAMSQAKLIGDLVDSARIASGKLRLELRPTNLFEIVKTVYNSQKPSAEAKKVNLEFHYDDERVPVFGDLVRLQQVFTNLLNNALKFTPEGGNISITLKTVGQRAFVSIKDDGQGISPEALPRIFRQFSQGDVGTSRDRSGLGLGLSIVKTLVEKQEGRVTAHSDGLGQGSVFTVELPIYFTGEISDRRPETRDQKDKPLVNVKLLFIEDDTDSREVIQLFLEQNGASVTSVESAERAFAVLEEQGDFDVIISDLAMPNEDGFSLMSRIRRLRPEKGGRIPALALSAFATNENKEKAFTSGFQKYHTKPFDPDTLIDDILSLVRK